MRRWCLSILALALAIALQSVSHAQQNRDAPVIFPDAEFEARQAKLWSGLKMALLGPNGATYWEQTLKDAGLPGGVAGIYMFEGTLVSSTPADHPNEFLVTIGDSTTPEAKLLMREHVEKPIPAGSPVTFEGKAIAYHADPYLLTFEVEGVNRLTEEDAKKKKKSAAAKQDEK
jgi:hypothetical protein